MKERIIEMKRSVAFLLILFFSFTAAVLGEEDLVGAQELRYSRDDFIGFFRTYGYDTTVREPERVDYKTVVFASFHSTPVSMVSLIERFPEYLTESMSTDRTDEDVDGYIVYALDDESALLVFIDNGNISALARFTSLCPAPVFDLTVIPFITTADMVAEIDKNTVFNPFIEWGPVSFHLMADGSFRQVTYMTIGTSRVLCVKDVEVVSREDCLSNLKEVNAEDLLPAFR